MEKNIYTERIELHCHSNYSEMDGVACPYDIVKFAQREGMPAVALTDHGSVMGFGEFESVTACNDCRVKPIYGIEAYIINDFEKAVYNYNGQNISKVVVVDVETTGLFAKKDGIIAIGAVKVCDGVITDQFQTLVTPDKEIPTEITELTRITNEMVADAPKIADALKAFIEFSEDNVLVAHNANFDLKFLKYAAEIAGIKFMPTYIDTVMLSKYLYPELKSYRLDAICKYLEIDTANCYSAVEDAKVCAQLFLNLIERLEKRNTPIDMVDAFMREEASVYTKMTKYHATVLIKNQKGKELIYDLISLAEQDASGRKIFSFRNLCDNRENILIGSGCEAGLLFRAIVDGALDDEIEKIAKRYDFIEVQPHTNNIWLLSSKRYPYIQSEQDLIDINIKLIKLGDALGIPVVATGDVHYLKKEDIISRNAFLVQRGFVDTDDTELFFRTTKEMLDAFPYLSDEKAWEIVVTNSNQIADMC